MTRAANRRNFDEVRPTTGLDSYEKIFQALGADAGAPNSTVTAFETEQSSAIPP